METQLLKDIPVISAPISRGGPLEKLAKSRGFSIIGQGTFKTVMTAPHHPGFAFVCFVDEGIPSDVKTLMACYSYSRGAGKNDPYLPRYFGKAKTEIDGAEIIMLKTERLWPAKARPWAKVLERFAFASAMQMAMIQPDFFAWIEKKYKVPYSIKQAMELTDPGSPTSLINFVEFMAMKHHDACFDWQPHNLLQRKDGHLVFNDIWA